MKEYLAQNKLLIVGFAVILIIGFTSSIFAALIGFLFFLLLIQKKKYSTAFLFFFLVLFFSDSRSHSLDFAKELKPPLAFVFGLIGMYFGMKRNLIPKWVMYFIPFFIWSLVLIFFSPVPMMALQKTVSYILLYLSVPVFFLYLLQTEGTAFLKNYIFIIFLLLLVGILLRFIIPEFVTLSERYRGLLGNPNGLGIFLICQFLLFQVLRSRWPVLFSKNELRWLHIIFLLSLLLSGSRTAMGVFLIFFILKWIYKRSVFIGVFSSIVLAVYGSFLLSYIPELIVSLGLDEYLRLDTLEEGSGRGVAWAFAWQQIQDNFFVGKGFVYTSYIYGKYTEILSLMGHQGNAHNSYLTFWLNTGLVGLVLYFIPFFRVVILAAKRNKIALPIFTGILISANFESWLTASLNPFTIVFLMIVTLLLYDGPVGGDSVEIIEA